MLTPTYRYGYDVSRKLGVNIFENDGGHPTEELYSICAAFVSTNYVI